MNCVMVVKGNPRTKTSFLHLSIPLGILSRAVNRLFAFEDRLVIFVEVVNDEEFMELRGVKNDDYLLTLEEGEKGGQGVFPKIAIKESKMLIGIDEEGKKYLKPGWTGREIIDLCSRGLIDILRGMGKELGKDDEVYLRITAAFKEEMSHVPRL